MLLKVAKHSLTQKWSGEDLFPSCLPLCLYLISQQMWRVFKYYIWYGKIKGKCIVKSRTIGKAMMCGKQRSRGSFIFFLLQCWRTMLILMCSPTPTSIAMTRISHRSSIMAKTWTTFLALHFFATRAVRKIWQLAMSCTFSVESKICLPREKHRLSLKTWSCPSIHREDTGLSDIVSMLYKHSIVFIGFEW